MRRLTLTSSFVHVNTIWGHSRWCSYGLMNACFQLITSNSMAIQLEAVQALAYIPRDVDTAAQLIETGCTAPLLGLLRHARTRRLLPSPDGPASPLFLEVVTYAYQNQITILSAL